MLSKNSKVLFFIAGIKVRYALICRLIPLKITGKLYDIPGPGQIDEMTELFLSEKDQAIPDRMILGVIIRESLLAYGQLCPDLNP